MLIEFSVKNFMSFKNKVTLSLEKGNGDENLDNIISEYDLLKTIAIYGANASGKSNILKALTISILMVRFSNIIPLGGKWDSFKLKSFLFDDKSSKEACEFEYIFIKNNIKYKYSFSADINNIYSESLDAYYSQKPTNIFKRYEINKYEFNNDKAVLESIALRNSNNKLFLSTAANWNYEKIKDPFLWFNNDIDTFENIEAFSVSDLKKYEKDEDLKKFTIDLLKEADILIKDVHVDYEEKEIDNELINKLVHPFVRDNPNNKYQRLKIDFEHEIKSENGIKTYPLNFYDESNGTKALFSFAPFLKRAFESQKIVVVDELEKSMHPSIVEFIVKLFNNKRINKNNSQLIFSTHATNLLDLNLLRRDQIWFTEKNPDTGVSDLYPLDSFSVRKGENIEKGYINGRYGAIPFIKDIDLWLEDK